MTPKRPTAVRQSCMSLYLPGNFFCMYSMGDRWRSSWSAECCENTPYICIYICVGEREVEVELVR